MIWGLGGSDVIAEGDVESAYTPPNNVFGYWALYCSYRDERWRVGKLVMCTLQTWPQKNIFAFGWRESPVEVTSPGDMRNGAPQANNVLWVLDGYSSYRDKRWRVGKPVTGTFQIWPQKFFAFGWRESPMEVTSPGDMGNGAPQASSVSWFPVAILRTETNDGASESQWWAHDKPDAKKKFLLHLDHPKARGKWCHRRVLPWPSHLIYVVHRITQCCRWYRDER